ncbi:tyrosine-type recombinase/integrase [Duganella fentianensis]|uniref:tyrosine-type recombinase/integrase n=1 Tax=Duganella fentianensis TaxID=2692177 RepID=UPI0032B10D45
MVTLARKFRFTQRDLDRLPPCPAESASKAYEVSDTDVTGLRLSVTKGGRKFWFWRYTFDGRKRAAKIGEYPATDLAAARKRASEMRSMLDQGKDAQASRDELKAMPSFTEFTEREYMPMARQTKRSHKDDAHRLKNHLLPRFGHKKLSEITTREIQAFIGEVAKSRSPATANRILSLLARMLKLATIWGIIEKNPCYGIAKFREQRTRERFLTRDEIARLFQAMEGDRHSYGVAGIKFLLLTGLRRNEALRAKWEQVDLGRGLMHLPQTKSGKSRHIVLSAHARMLLEELPSRGHSQWIFPGKNLADDLPVYNIDKCLQRLLEKAGIERMRVHDLRHTYASVMAQNGVSLFVIQSALGHSSPMMTMRYAHLCDTALRDATNVVGNVVSAALSGDAGGLLMDEAEGGMSLAPGVAGSAEICR